MMYGDLDISLIDEMPPGRKKVNTYVVDEGYRERLNGFIKKQVENDVQQGGENEEVKRTAGVANSPHDSGTHVVDEKSRNAGKVDGEVFF